MLMLEYDILTPFTAQVIWASTSKVGMAVASDGAGGYYVVARYNPAGNM